MQKLKITTKALIRGQHGSALVSVVVFSVLLAISGAAYLGITTNSVNREVSGLNDLKAFAAAESGLLLGTQWLVKQTTWPTTDVPGIITTTVDGISVSVDIDEDAGDIRVVSTSAVNGASYDKTLSWIVMQGEQSSGSLGTFFDDVMTFPGGNTHGIRKLDFDGPVHANSPIKIANGGAGNIPTFNSPVTVYNPSNTGNAGYGQGHFDNDYTKGVLVANGSPPNFDDVFLSTYDGSAQKKAVAFDATGGTTLTLSSSNNLVTFGVSAGTPTYTYTDVSNVTHTVSYSASAETKIRIAGGEVLVNGTVKGKVTLYSDAPTEAHPNTDIRIIDDLIYDGFNVASFNPDDPNNNFGLGNNNPNILALYSGGAIKIDTEKDAPRLITAQLFATSDGQTVEFVIEKKKDVVNLIGTRSVDYYWDEKQGNDQTTFNFYWDRRQLSAPGLRYGQIDDNGNPMLTLSHSQWTETNRAK